MTCLLAIAMPGSGISWPDEAAKSDQAGIGAFEAALSYAQVCQPVWDCLDASPLARTTSFDDGGR